MSEHTVFLSYARADDEPFVHRLYDTLTAKGLSVWFDRKSMPARGLTFSENIKRAVLDSQRLLLIVGPAALESEYVTKEWQTALGACIPIIPLMRLSDYSALPPELAITDAPDFRDDTRFDHWLDYLLRQIAEDVPPLGQIYGLRFQLPRGYVLRRELWTELNQAVRGDSIGAEVATSREQITALQGMAGLGKTTIAAAYAESCDVRRTFDSGVFWLTAGRLAEALGLMTTLGVWLGDHREEYKDADIAVQRLSNLLRSRRALIVLDDVWSRELVEAFRPTLGADCRLLFTTRDARIPTLTQAQRVRVETLSLDEGVRVIGRWQDRPPQDDSADRNPHYETERAIVDLLKGHTLAVTLAAARIDEVGAAYAPTLLTEYQRARDTQNPFSDLELAPDDKNWSVEISLRLSYDTLQPEAQTRFRQLGVLAENATFSTETAAAVWEADTPKPTLNTLESGALIELEPDGRYSQHSVLRAYAAALLRRENTHDSVWMRYAAYFTEQAKQFVDLPAEDWRDTIERDVLHILAVGDGLVERQEKPEFQELAVEFAYNTTGFVFYRMEHQRRGWLEMGLALSRAMDNQQRESLFLNQLGLLWSALGEKRKALECYEYALPLRRALGDRVHEAATLNNIGRVWSDLGEKHKALEYYEQALLICRVVGDRAGEAVTLNSIGLVWSDLGEKRKALEYHQQALPLCRMVGNHAGEAATLNNIGGVWDDLGEKQKALECFEQALPICCAMGNRAGEAATLNNIGGVWDALGEKQKALAYYEQALPIRRAVGDRTGEANTLNNIGLVWFALEEKRKALDYYEEALPIFRAVGDRTGEATTLNNIGEAHRALGDPYKALEYFEQALPISRAVGNSAGEAVTLNNVGRVWDALGEKEKALLYYEKALPILRAVDDRDGEATVISGIVEIYHILGEPHKALAYLEQALPIIRAVGDRAGEVGVLNKIGMAYRDFGDPHKALEYFEQALPILRAVDNRTDEAATLNNIGMVYRALGNPHKALEYFEVALPIIRALGDKVGEAATLNNIGAVYRTTSELQRALEYFEQALPISRAVSDGVSEAAVLNNIGMVWNTLGEKRKALEYFEQVLPISRAVGNREGEATTLNNMSVMYFQSGDLARAVEIQRQILDIFRAVDDAASEAASLFNLAIILVQTGERNEAIMLAQQSIAILERHNLPQDAWGATMSHRRQFLAQFTDQSTPQGQSTLPDEMVNMLAGNTYAVMTTHKDKLSEWQPVLTQHRDDFASRGDGWAIEVAFAETLLAILAGARLTLPADNPYAGVVQQVLDAIDGYTG